MKYLYRGIRIDDRTENYINKKIESVGKLINSIFFSEIEIGMDKKGKFRVEIMIKTPYHKFRAEKTSESIEGSVDEVKENLKRQIVRYKEKTKTLSERGGRSLKKRATISEKARFRGNSVENIEAWEM